MKLWSSSNDLRLGDMMITMNAFTHKHIEVLTSDQMVATEITWAQCFVLRVNWEK